MIREKDWTNIDWSKYQAIHGNVINSVITYPLNGSQIELPKTQKDITLKGWAIGDGLSGSRVEKVEISFDDGATWKKADID